MYPNSTKDLLEQKLKPYRYYKKLIIANHFKVNKQLLRVNVKYN